MAIPLRICLLKYFSATIFLSFSVTAHHLNPDTARIKAESINKLIENDTKIVTNEKFIDYLSRTLLHFDANFCYGKSVNAQSRRCREFIENNKNISKTVIKYLDLLPSQKSTTKMLMELLAVEIGSSMRAIGWTSHEEMSKSDFINNVNYVSTDNNYLCIDIRDTSTVDNLDIILLGGNDTFPLAEALPKTTGRERLPPATQILHSKIEVNLNTSIVSCSKDCMNKIKESFVKAISSWKEAASGRDKSSYALIDFGDKLFIDRNVLASNNRQSPIPSQFSYLYEEIPRDSLCTEVIKDDSQYFSNFCHAKEVRRIEILVTDSPECGKSNSEIACADTKSMYINARDFGFTEDINGESIYLFGNLNGDKVNLLNVLIHETGHWFALPHLREISGKAISKANIMNPTYSPKSCIKLSNIRTLSQVLLYDWDYAQRTCAGLTYPEKF